MIHKYCQTQTEEKIFKRGVEKRVGGSGEGPVVHQMLKTMKQITCPHCDEIIYEKQLDSELIDWYTKKD